MARRPRPDAPAPVLAAGGGAGLRELPGVGPAMAEKLAARGLLSVQDLWLHLPLRYEDRTRLTAIRDLVPGEPAQVEGRVEAVERGFRYRPLLRVTVVDDSRASLGLRFFHFNAAQAAQFVVGRRVRCYGEPRPAGRRKSSTPATVSSTTPKPACCMTGSTRCIRAWRASARRCCRG